MGFTKNKLILPLVFILVIISLLRVLKLTIISSSFSSSSVQPVFLLNTIKQQGLPEKEIRFLFDILLQKSPCSILVFGFEHAYLKLHSFNEGGTTVFLENSPEIVNKMKGEFKSYDATRVYKVEYITYAKDAYELLKHARSSSSCDFNSGMTNVMLECKLVPTGLPKEVMETKWDVIVVDGPCGDGPGSPGRMGSIFTAAVLARAGNGTNVVVHDVDRMIEKWFSWEFLCDENRVSSKGRFWNFKVPPQETSDPKPSSSLSHRPGKEPANPEPSSPHIPDLADLDEETVPWDWYPSLVAGWVRDMDVPEVLPTLWHSFDRAFAALIKNFHAERLNLDKLSACVARILHREDARDKHQEERFAQLEREVGDLTGVVGVLTTRCEAAEHRAEAAEHRAEAAEARAVAAENRAIASEQHANAMEMAYIDAIDPGTPPAQEPVEEFGMDPEPQQLESDPEEDPEEPEEIEEEPKEFEEPEELEEPFELEEPEEPGEEMDIVLPESEDEGSVITTESDAYFF